MRACCSSGGGASAVCIYGLSEPEEDWNVRYVGKAQQKPGESPAHTIARRLRHHLTEARNHQGSGYRKLNRLRHHLSQAQTPGSLLLDIGETQTWESLEKWHIAAHRAAGYDLVNETDGGDGAPGYVYTPQQRLARSV